MTTGLGRRRRAGAAGGVEGRAGRAERENVMGTRCRVRGAGGLDVKTTGRHVSAAALWRGIAVLAALLSLAAPLPASAAGRVAPDAAAAGTTAADGDGRNSPYTAALLTHLEEPVEIGLLFRRGREGVLTATSGRQRPHEYQSLLREHHLSGGAAAATAGGPAVPAGGAAARGPAEAGPTAVVAGGSSAVLAQQETVFWQSIVAGTNRADFEAYLARWPEGVYAPLARGRVAALRAPADPPRSNLPSEAVSEASDALTPGGRDGAGFRDCPDCPEMTVIPAGEFLMGSPVSEEGRSDHEGPQRRVALRSFALGVAEVTFDEWEACVRGGGCNGYRLADRGAGAYPVVDVSWQDARAYAAWLSRKTGASYRLPSEAEWEYAARGGTTTSRYWGDSSASQCGHANGADAAAKRVYSDWTTATACDDGAVRAVPAGSYSANAFGIFDMLGSVWEWTDDCWVENYRGAPADGSPRRGGDCGRRVLRGGSWFNAPRDLRSAARVGTPAELRRSFAGFRVARTLD